MIESDCFTREKLVELITAAMKGEFTVGQREELERWLAERKENRTFFEEVQEDARVRENLLLYKRFDPVRDWRQVDPARRAWRRFSRRVSVAAGIALLLGGPWALRHFLVGPDPRVDVTVTTEVLPGTHKARLTVESGTTFVLGAARDSMMVLPEEVLQEDDSRLLYREVAGGEVTWHTLEVPRGGEYRLELSDGTLITLNAGSRIRYPNRFEGAERRVELEGEAFFSVTRQEGCPFIVSSDQLQVRVLGTSFNLKVYPGERQQTTLLAGRVVVDCGEESVPVQPGEQLTWNGRAWSVRQVDVTPYIAWKEQRFVFDDELLEDVLRQLERWYDINVYIRYPSLKEIRYTGNLPKYEDIDKVLHLLELAAHVHFNLSGRTLFVEKE
ncbi:MAG: FecR family protein [Odoribacteraceae bacterium]|nr:FecR family protein [Odoribacteraceae bacterium]